MKKACFCMILIGFLVILGCVNKPQPPAEVPISQRSFQTTVDISYQSLEMTALLAHEKSGAYRLDLLSPKLLEGLTVRLSDDALTVQYQGLSAGYSADSSFLRGPTMLLFEAVDRMVTSGETDYSDVFSDGTVYTVSFSPEDQELFTLESDEHQLKITFSDFIFTDI